MLKGNSQKGRWEYRLKRNRTWSQGPHGPQEKKDGNIDSRDRTWSQGPRELQEKEDGKIDSREIEDKTRVLMDLRS